jgi:hypothetical protein
MSIEDSYYEIAKSSGKPTVILTDRAVMDKSAFFKHDEWEIMMDGILSLIKKIMDIL